MRSKASRRLEALTTIRRAPNAGASAIVCSIIRPRCPFEIYDALQKCIIYTFLSNGDCRTASAFAGLGPRRRAKIVPPRSERPAMTMEDQMKGPLKHRTLSAAIVDQPRQSILDGTYPAGSQ